MRDHYSALGVPRTASMEEIRNAYHEHVMRHHPDLNPDVLDSSRFREVQEAYEVIGDPTKRRQYDESLRSEPRSTTEAGPTRGNDMPEDRRPWPSGARRPPVWPSNDPRWMPVRETGGDWRDLREGETDEWIMSPHASFYASRELSELAARLRALLFGDEWFDP